MNLAVTASAILLLGAQSGRCQQPVAADFNDPTQRALFSLYMPCDLIDEFVTLPIDPGVARLFDTPVSIEGARLERESRQTRVWGMVRLPLMVDNVSLQRMDDNHSRPLDVRKAGRNIRLASAGRISFDAPAHRADAPVRTESSTWVRIRALFGD